MKIPKKIKSQWIWIFNENTDPDENGIYQVASSSLKRLRKEICLRFDKEVPEDDRGDLEFQKRFGAVVYKYGGDVVGWIKKIKMV